MNRYMVLEACWAMIGISVLSAETLEQLILGKGIHLE